MKKTIVKQTDKENENKTVDIYWNELSEETRQELLSKGYDNQNIIDGVFPVTTVFIDSGDE